MRNLIQMTLKLLFRNKGFWLILLTVPAVSMFMMHLKTDEDLAMFRSTTTPEVQELDNVEQKVAYYGKEGEFVVKVLDASQSELSDFFLERLARSGMIQVCRAKATEMTKEEADASLKISGFEDRMGAGVYLPQSFDEALLSGDTEGALTLYVLSDDERLDLFIREVREILTEIRDVAKNEQARSEGSTALQAERTAESLKKLHESDPSVEIRSLAKQGEVELTKEQVAGKTHMGYAFSFLTLGFVFIGTLVAQTAIEEERHKVYTRILLTGMDYAKYFASKLAVTMIVALMLSGVLGIQSFFIDESQLGMSRPAFLMLVFLLGLIFACLSMMAGVLCGNAMTSNYIAFALWSLSSMLAGLYFPLNDASSMVKAISYMMPQRWFMDSLNLIFTGDKQGYLVVLYTTVAFMIMILSLGAVGLKIKKSEA